MSLAETEKKILKGDSYSPSQREVIVANPQLSLFEVLNNESHTGTLKRSKELFDIFNLQWRLVFL